MKFQKTLALSVLVATLNHTLGDDTEKLRIGCCPFRELNVQVTSEIDGDEGNPLATIPTWHKLVGLTKKKLDKIDYMDAKRLMVNFRCAEVWDHASEAPASDSGTPDAGEETRRLAEDDLGEVPESQRLLVLTLDDEAVEELKKDIKSFNDGETKLEAVKKLTSDQALAAGKKLTSDRARALFPSSPVDVQIIANAYSYCGGGHTVILTDKKHMDDKELKTAFGKLNKCDECYIRWFEKDHNYISTLCNIGKCTLKAKDLTQTGDVVELTEKQLEEVLKTFEVTKSSATRVGATFFILLAAVFTSFYAALT